jgi:hypothetical protein
LIAAIGERCDFIDDRIRHAGNETVGELRWVNLHHAVEPRLRIVLTDQFNKTHSKRIRVGKLNPNPIPLMSPLPKSP